MAVYSECTITHRREMVFIIHVFVDVLVGEAPHRHEYFIPQDYDAIRNASLPRAANPAATIFRVGVPNR